MNNTKKNSCRTSRARIGTAALAALMMSTVLGTTLVTAVPPAVAAHHGGGLTGFGAKVATWAAAHPKDASGCNATSCYGPSMNSSSAKFEFTYVTTSKGRVDGYDQALHRGTSLLRAELEVAELFPIDVTMNSFNVRRHDYYGSSCAFYDLQSKTIENTFGKAAFGGTDGTIGVELATVLSNGTITYNPDNLNLALVVPTYLSSSDNC